MKKSFDRRQLVLPFMLVFVFAINLLLGNSLAMAALWTFVCLIINLLLNKLVNGFND